MPLTDHTTLASVAFVTVGVNDARWPVESVALGGAMVTPTLLVTVTVAEAISGPPLGWGVTVAWIVTGFGEGTSAGAVYCAVVALVATIVPRVESPPATPPTSHAMLAPLARQKEAVKDCVAPSPTLADGGRIEFVAEQVTVALALPDFEASAALVAVTVTVAGEGGANGAVYCAVAAPVETIVPMVEFPPAIPLTLQLTAADGLPVPATFAVNTCTPFAGTFTAAGETVIAMSSFKFTVAEALADKSASLTAVTVTLGGDGSALGAVYSPKDEMVPSPAVPPATPFTFHATLVSDAPVTVA
jgi:hypothetical protein